MIPLRDTVVLPHARVPLVVGRPGSSEAVEVALARDGRVLLVRQQDPEVREPSARDLNAVGTVARIVEESRLRDGHRKLVVEGRRRARITSLTREKGHLAAAFDTPRERGLRGGLEDVRARLARALEEHAQLRGDAQLEPLVELAREPNLARACDQVASRLDLASAVLQELLEEWEPSRRVERLLAVVDSENERLRVELQLNKEVQRHVSRSQREYILQEKMKVIRQELGLGGVHADVERLGEAIAAAGMPAAAREKAERELRRLEATAATSAEATVSRGYIDWLLAVPWKKRSRDRRDVERARVVLEEDHHGLDRVKERMIEFLAVRSLRKGRPPRGSVLCFVGPPGVGKTSLGRSIARATGRRFVRASLGGVRDEADIRGHRRTYVGAYPGRIIEGLRRAGTRNPVFLLDEIDKMAADFRGDPSAALLEVLDPEQNHAFLDHYLDTEVDLSEVMFACTANVLHSVPDALRDRLEVIRLPGYGLEEKLAIAERFLVPRQAEENGLSEGQLELGSEALRAVIEGYTREAGVRGLERELASLCRKTAVRVLADPGTKVRLASADDVSELLGPRLHRGPEMSAEPEVGVATGLSWTAAGGRLLSVEASVLSGRGKLLVTGQVGEVMRESLRAAVSYARSRSARFRLPEDLFREVDVHVHVPEGAIPKDGPSAGITMAVAVVSALTGRPVRHDVAMTGEITLRGRVLPVGGLREKLLAARRAGLRTVLVPKGTDRELAEVDADLRGHLEVVAVESMDEVLALALLPAGRGRRSTRTAGGRRAGPRSRRESAPS